VAAAVGTPSRVEALTPFPVLCTLCSHISSIALESLRSFTKPFLAETSGLNQGRSKYGPQNHRALFSLHFEKDYAILARTKAPFSNVPVP
jgi:hypothetical protein